MKFYIAGKITGLARTDYEAKFTSFQRLLEDGGHKVMNPACINASEGFEHEDYMHICYAMIDVCDAVYMLKDWQQSKGARMELQYAADHKKEIFYEDESTREENFPILHGYSGAI
ncbi:MAG: DUF4406 domain-containing protein [Treponema sp.]|nr:DUF4406 domain-containing protein [Treponema sp.]